MVVFKCIFIFFIILCQSICYGQNIFVYNTAGASSTSSDFTTVSSLSEPVTSFGSHIEHGFLMKKRNNPFKEDHFAIYPNPSSDVLFIEIGLITDLIIYNSIGQLVFSMRLSSGLNKIMVDNFSNGIYYLMLQSEQLSIKGYKVIKY
jgi:hypothetical protein